MPLTCDEIDHREALLASDWAACYGCLREFRPSAIEFWCDHSRTALCPFCGLDFVLGFNGVVDRDILIEGNKNKFPWRWAHDS